MHSQRAAIYTGNVHELQPNLLKSVIQLIQDFRY